MIPSDPGADERREAEIAASSSCIVNGNVNDRRKMAVTHNVKVISVRWTCLLVSGNNVLQPVLQSDLALEPKLGKGTTVAQASEGSGQFAIIEIGFSWDEENDKTPCTVACQAYVGVIVHVVVLGEMKAGQMVISSSCISCLRGDRLVFILCVKL